jgi:hypothetical protein
MVRQAFLCFANVSFTWCEESKRVSRSSRVNVVTGRRDQGCFVFVRKVLNDMRSNRGNGKSSLTSIVKHSSPTDHQSFGCVTHLLILSVLSILDSFGEEMAVSCKRCLRPSPPWTRPKHLCDNNLIISPKLAMSRLILGFTPGHPCTFYIQETSENVLICYRIESSIRAIGKK